MTTDGYYYAVALVLFVFVAVVIYRLPRPKLAFIEKPILAFLDLSGGDNAADLVADRASFGSLFYFVIESTSWPPKCDVLFVYCRLEDDGRIHGWKSGLRDLIRESGASIAVLAADNTAEASLAAAKETGYGRANLVLTFDRRGELFGEFFYKLFNAMKQGTSMSLAWVQIAPQIPGRDHPDMPSSLFLCEAGQIAFR